MLERAAADPTRSRHVQHPQELHCEATPGAGKGRAERGNLGNASHAHCTHTKQGDRIVKVRSKGRKGKCVESREARWGVGPAEWRSTARLQFSTEKQTPFNDLPLHLLRGRLCAESMGGLRDPPHGGTRRDAGGRWRGRKKTENKREEKANGDGSCVSAAVVPPTAVIR